MVPLIVKKVVRIVLNGPPFNQSNYAKASLYQFPYDHSHYEAVEFGSAPDQLKS